MQRDHQRRGFGGGNQFAAFAMQVFFVQQAFDDRGACGRCTEAFFFHRGAQLFIIDCLAGALHRRQQRCLRIAGWGLGYIGFYFDRLGLDLLARFHRGKIGCGRFVIHIPPVNGEPARIHHYFAL